MNNKIIRRTLTLALYAIIAWSIGACTVDDTEYTRKYRCYFVFDSQLHDDKYIVHSCVNPLSSGMFFMVWQGTDKGVRHIYTQLNDGKTNGNNAITTRPEADWSCVMGAANGLIIGCSSLNNSMLYAFDRACPNCLEEGTTKALSWDNNGQWVKCPRCLRSYDLNNSGFIVKGEKGKKLLRYRSSFAEPILRVTN